jgi:hypothetical protein
MRSFVFILAISSLCACSSSSPPAPGPATSDLASGGTGGNGPVDAGPTGAATTVIVQVPASFTGTPRQLLVAAFAHFPVTGPPDGVIYQGTPSLTPGQPLHLSGDASGLHGSENVLAVLYVQGGGQFSPQPGVDYASAPEQVVFTGKPIDLGTLTLAIVPVADGGP